jgi:hypothetical protein
MCFAAWFKYSTKGAAAADFMPFLLTFQIWLIIIFTSAQAANI